MRPKLYFVPTYIGPLKYFERLIPRLRDTYDVGFLFIGPVSERQREAAKYCKEKKYPFWVINEGFQKETRTYLPIFSLLVSRYRHSRACQQFLKTQKPKKIVSTKATYVHDTILKEANRMNIETIVLQWASAGPRRAGFREERKKTFRHTVSLFLYDFFSRIIDIFYIESRFGLTPAVPKKIGVFDEEEGSNGIGKYYDPEIVHVVGTIDFQEISELKQKTETDYSFRKKMLNRYGLNENKIKILVILYRFYLHDDAYKMAVEKYLEYYRQIFKTIRNVFPLEDAEIILKMHPGEKRIYESYKDLGVKIYHDESRTDELLCLSDLYIADPSTSVNYMLLASGIPAIFVNFSKLTHLNNLMKYFGIKKTIIKNDEFVESLKLFKKGMLEKQYDSDLVDTCSLDNTIRLINQ